MNAGTTIILLTVLAVTPLFADDSAAPAFRIEIEVTIADDDLRDRVTRYLTTQLRSLDDVAVGPENPDYKLYAMAMELRTAGGVRMAYVLGITVTTFFPDGYFDTVMRNDLRNFDEVTQRLEGVPVYENQFLSLAGPSEANLIEAAQNSVAKFSMHILEPQRKAD